jgi:hypothetical protein
MITPSAEAAIPRVAEQQRAVVRIGRHDFFQTREEFGQPIRRAFEGEQPGAAAQWRKVPAPYLLPAQGA